MSKFILAVHCPVCDNVIKDSGYTLDFTTDDNVVTLDNFACTHFHCDNCGTDVYVGDIDCLYAYDENEDLGK